jgi:hypothetical protein
MILWNGTATMQPGKGTVHLTCPLPPPRATKGGKFHIITKSDDVYIVEKVLKTRKRNGKLEYFVKWRGYPDKFNSWTTDVYKP